MKREVVMLNSQDDDNVLHAQYDVHVAQHVAAVFNGSAKSDVIYCIKQFIFFYIMIELKHHSY